MLDQVPEVENNSGLQDGCPFGGILAGWMFVRTTGPWAKVFTQSRMTCFSNFADLHPAVQTRIV